MSSHNVTIPIILASISPRRRQLLALMGVPFEAAASEVDETMLLDEIPAELAARLSLVKARAVALVHREAVVIAADTLVALGDDVLGKPRDEIDAFGMLARLRGREHSVYSGLSVVDGPGDRRCTQVIESRVHMRDYTDDEIRRYIGTGDPFDKAGGYAIQNATFDPVAQVDGCYTNVMGLPMCHLYRLLKAWGIDVPVHPLDCCPLAVEKGCVWSSKITEMPKRKWYSQTCMGDD